MSASPPATIASACLRLGDESDRHRGDAGGASNRACERHVHPGACRGDLLQRRNAGARDVDPVAPARLQFQRERNRILERPAAVHPVGGGNARAERALARPRRAHRVEDFQRKAHATATVAAVRIIAPVRERREELVQQIAVREVQLERVDADRFRAPRGGDECLLHPHETRGIERGGRRFACGMRNRRRRDGRPSARGRRDQRAAFPRALRRALPAGVRELQGDCHRRCLPARARKAVAQCAFRGVVVQAEASWRDASIGRHRSGLDRHHARPRKQHLSPVNEVPVRRAAFVGRVLAHRRDDDAVRQRERAQRDGVEEVHGLAPSQRPSSPSRKRAKAGSRSV